jgi:hypothetical protein
MFVVSYTDIPDEILFEFDDMIEKLKEIGCIAVYHDRIHGKKWTVWKKYTYYDGAIYCVSAGDWNVPPSYFEYADPNKCPDCKLSKFMQGNYCMDCHSCPECGETEFGCLC